MPVTYTEAARQAGEGYAALQQTTEELKYALGRSFGQVNAEWDREEDEKGRATYVLRLSDGTDEVTGRFAPDELQPSNHLRYRLLRLWLAFLEHRNERQLRELQMSLAQEG